MGDKITKSNYVFHRWQTKFDINYEWHLSKLWYFALYDNYGQPLWELCYTYDLYAQQWKYETTNIL